MNTGETVQYIGPINMYQMTNHVFSLPQASSSAVHMFHDRSAPIRYLVNSFSYSVNSFVLFVKKKN